MTMQHLIPSHAETAERSAKHQQYIAAVVMNHNMCTPSAREKNRCEKLRETSCTMENLSTLSHTLM